MHPIIPTHDIKDPIKRAIAIRGVYDNILANIKKEQDQLKLLDHELYLCRKQEEDESKPPVWMDPDSAAHDPDVRR